ncbi:MAG: hypothetical protein E7176_01160 [Erysipelotrichaceae bacterium]|nr:hypothetical protein [Erysipelotrichaceae bacterium]
MLRKILIITLCLISILFIYLSCGYFIRACNQPTLLGNEKTFYFFGFYILAIVYTLAAAISIAGTIIIFFKFRRAH